VLLVFLYMYFVCVCAREHERVCEYMFIYTVFAGVLFYL